MCVPMISETISDASPSGSSVVVLSLLRRRVFTLEEVLPADAVVGARVGVVPRFLFTGLVSTIPFYFAVNVFLIKCI